MVKATKTLTIKSQCENIDPQQLIDGLWLPKEDCPSQNWSCIKKKYINKQEECICLDIKTTGEKPITNYLRKLSLSKDQSAVSIDLRYKDKNTEFNVVENEGSYYLKIKCIFKQSIVKGTIFNFNTGILCLIHNSKCIMCQFVKPNSGYISSNSCRDAFNHSPLFINVYIEKDTNEIEVFFAFYEAVKITNQIKSFSGASVLKNKESDPNIMINDLNVDVDFKTAKFQNSKIEFDTLSIDTLLPILFVPKNKYAYSHFSVAGFIFKNTFIKPQFYGDSIKDNTHCVCLVNFRINPYIAFKDLFNVMSIYSDNFAFESDFKTKSKIFSSINSLTQAVYSNIKNNINNKKLLLCMDYMIDESNYSENENDMFEINSKLSMSAELKTNLLVLCNLIFNKRKNEDE